MQDIPGADITPGDTPPGVAFSYDFETCAVCAEGTPQSSLRVQEILKRGVLSCVKWGFIEDWPKLKLHNVYGSKPFRMRVQSLPWTGGNKNTSGEYAEWFFSVNPAYTYAYGRPI